MAGPFRFCLDKGPVRTVLDGPERIVVTVLDDHAVASRSAI